MKENKEEKGDKEEVVGGDGKGKKSPCLLHDYFMGLKQL